MFQKLFRNSIFFSVLCSIILSCLFVVPLKTYAVDSIVPCGNRIEISGGGGAGVTYENECSVCHLQTLAMNILNFLVLISLAIAALLFANAGFLYVTSPANPGNIARAHKMFMSTIIGLVLILAAYLLIDVIMKSLLAGGEGKVNTYGPWNEILCKNFENKYTVPPLGTITLKPEELVLSPYQDGVDCKVLIGVCNVLCPVNTEVRWGTSCEKNIADKKCCVPIESSNICKMSDGSAGGCQSFDFCLDNAEINPACGTTGLVCCPSKDFEKSGDMVGACEGKDMINAPKWSGHVSCACGNAISMNTVNGVNELFNEYGNKVLVTSLTCESHLSQAHPSGIAADLEDSTGMKGIVTTTWTKIPNATWSDGTEVYEKQGGSIRCAVESNHLHCEFVTFDQTRNRK